MNRIVLIIRPPKSLCDYLHQKILLFENKNNHTHFRPVFDPHITILFIPIPKLNKGKIKKKVLVIVKKYIPIEIEYKELYCSSFNTINLKIASCQHLYKLHQELLTNLNPEFIYNLNNKDLLSTYNTTNIGSRFSPHLTIDKCDTKKNAESFISLCKDFIPIKQVVFSLDLMDGVSFPMNLFCSIK